MIPGNTKTDGFRIATKVNALTSLVVVVAVAGTMVLLWRMQTNIQRDQRALTTRIHQMELARIQQVNFKKQVQEWKDILLRGHNAADFEKYRAQFFAQERLVRENGERLMEALAEPSIRGRVAMFLERHEQLGRNYRHALEAFELSGRSDYQGVDRSVRGMDRGLTDLADGTVASIKQELEHYEIAHGAALVRERRYTTLIVIALFSGFMLVSILVARRITRPIAGLAEAVAKISTDKDYSIRAVRSSRDELGLLADGFNDMVSKIEQQDAALRQSRDELERRVEERTGELTTVNGALHLEIADRKKAQEELEATHRKLLEVSRQAGMAEVATSVLHNVGNVLNSVNVSSGCLADNFKKSKIVNLSKVVALLREREADLGAFLTVDPKGQHIPDYLAQLAGHLSAEQVDALKELAGLQKNIEHIKDIVAMQQNFAQASGVTELVKVTDLVEDALRMNSSGLERHEIEVNREFKDAPLVTVEKHKVLQILINLVRNAKHACDGMGLEQRKMTVRTTNGDGHVRIAVCDNGVGIPAENLNRIFSHGFTTKKDGHGFGLHSGALAAREMGGALSVRSDGPGRGAVFTLELPLPGAVALT